MPAQNSDYVTVMRIEEGKAVVALFKEANGKVSTRIFLQGASVRRGESVHMLPDKKAVYSMSASTDDYGREDTCGVGAYQWDAQRRIFVWNKLLSKQITKIECPKKGTQTGAQNEALRGC